MGKKERQKPQGKKNNPWLIWAVAAVLVLGGGGLAYQNFDGAPAQPHPVTGGETHPIMDARNFSGRAYTGYLAASLYPEAMDQVYCYCQCDRPPFLHKSLRSCFATTHGAS